MPFLSVVMPVHNCRPYLADAIASIRTQTYADFELIIIDDGSTDGSSKIIDAAATADSRIRVIRRANTGIVGALNDGLAAACGEIIARMDGDDLADPRRFAEQIAFLDAHPDCVAVGCAVWLIDRDGAVIDRYAPPLKHAPIEAQLLTGNGAALVHPAVMLRRAAVDAIGGYRPERNRAEDFDLFLRIGRQGTLANLPLPLLSYRVHADSTNFVHREQQRALCALIVKEARSERGLPSMPAGDHGMAPADLSPATRHRGWVITALRWGRRSTAIKHALLAMRAEPAVAASWRHLRYALTAPPPISS